MRTLLILFLISASFVASAQYINRDGYFTLKGRLGVGKVSEQPAHAWSWLEIGDSATAKSMILPRVAGTYNILVPKVGMLHYDTWNDKIYVRKPLGWFPLVDSSMLTTYTDVQVRAVVALFIQNNRGISWAYDSASATFVPTIDLSDFLTDELPEGATNLYYTDARARLALHSGPGIYYDSTTGTITNTRTGTVRSVGLQMPSGFLVSNSPVTDSGTLNVTTSLNGILQGNGSGFGTVTIGPGLAYNGTTLSATGGGSGGSGTILTPMSVTGGGSLDTVRTLALINDDPAPPPYSYYGADSTGTLGYHRLPDSLYSARAPWTQDSMYKFSAVVEWPLYVDSTSTLTNQDTLKIEQAFKDKVAVSISKAEADQWYMPIDATFAAGDKFFTGDGVATGDRYHDFDGHNLFMFGFDSLSFKANQYFLPNLQASNLDTVLAVNPATGKLSYVLRSQNVASRVDSSIFLTRADNYRIADSVTQANRYFAGWGLTLAAHTFSADSFSLATRDWTKNRVDSSLAGYYTKTQSDSRYLQAETDPTIPHTADATTYKYLNWNGAAWVRKQIQASEVAGLSTVATSGDYNDLINKPASTLTSIALNTPNLVFSNPVNFSNTGGAWTGSLTLNNQSAYSYLGRDSATTGPPKFGKINVRGLDATGSTYDGTKMLLDNGTWATAATASTRIKTLFTDTYSATPTFDGTYINHIVTLTGNVTSISVSNLNDGEVLYIKFVQDATGSRTVPSASSSWISGNAEIEGGTITLTTTGAARDLVGIKRMGTKYIVTYKKDLK